MTMLSPEQALVAVDDFLHVVWERMGKPGDVGVFLGMIGYVPGEGTADPAIWYDWLAIVNKQQTGVLVPENAGKRGSLTSEVLKPLDAEQAYLAMYAFIEEYWNRVSRQAEIGDLLGVLRYTPGAGTTDPSIWQAWLAEFERARTLSKS